MNRKILLLAWCMCASVPIMAQQTAIDSAFVSAATANATRELTKKTSIQSHLYNGVAFYEPRLTNPDQFPFLVADDWTIGTITYDGEVHPAVPLMYDIQHDDIITEIPANGARIKLIKEKISAFTIYDRNFVNLRSPAPKDGFYALLYDGKTKVYGRFEKNRQERVESSSVTIEFEERIRYYIQKNGNFFQVKSKGDILKIFSDKKHELKQLSQKTSIKFKKNREQSIVKLAALYDSTQP